MSSQPESSKAGAGKPVFSSTPSAISDRLSLASADKPARSPLRRIEVKLPMPVSVR